MTQSFLTCPPDGVLRRFSLSWLAPLLLSFGLAAGCSEPDRVVKGKPGGQVGDFGDGDVGAGDGDEQGGDGDGRPSSGLGCNKMDIVFIIDNSGSMREEQDLLAQSFPKMIDVLERYKGGALDYRVAVANTSFPDELLGSLEQLFGLPSSQKDVDGMFMRTEEMERPWLQRGDDDLEQTFTEIATVGTNGSGQEQPLGAALSAVTKRLADSNKGFLREDALLALVIVTDEDDGTVSGESIMLGPIIVSGGEEVPVSSFVEDFDQVTGDRSRWASAVIAGSSDCESALGEASEAKRLKEFVKETGDNAIFSDICEGNLDKALTQALDTFAVACDDYDLF